MSKGVKGGSEIIVEYRIRLSDGRIVEEGLEDDAIALTVGDRTLPEAVETALHSMQEGDSQLVMVNADEAAFGEHDGEKVLHLQRAEFSDEVDPEVGSLVGFSMPSGEEVAGRVVSTDGEQVEVDFNHPLIGHDIFFEVKIIELLDAGDD